MVECWGGKWLPARVVQIVAEAPSLGKLSIAPPPPSNCWLPLRSAGTGFFVIDWSDWHVLCLFLSLNHLEGRHANWWATCSAEAQLTPLNIYRLGKRHAMEFIVMAQSGLAVHTNFHCFRCCVPCVMEITVGCNFVPDKYAINHTNNYFVHPLSEFSPHPFRQ